MIFDKVRDIIADQLGIEKDGITMETDFKKDLQADSLDLFQIINEIEEAYDITIDDAEGIATVGDVVKFVEFHK